MMWTFAVFVGNCTLKERSCWNLTFVQILVCQRTTDESLLNLYIINLMSLLQMPALQIFKRQLWRNICFKILSILFNRNGKKRETWMSCYVCSFYCCLQSFGDIFETFPDEVTCSWSDHWSLKFNICMMMTSQCSLMFTVWRGESDWVSAPWDLTPHSTPDSRVTPQTRSWINLNKTNQRQAKTLNKYEKLEL